MNSPILAFGARLCLPLFITFALYMLMRGHNAPGGGFVAGLILAAGFALYAFAFDSAEARRILRFDPRNLGVAGLILALLAGFLPALQGLAPFTGLWPDAGGLPLSNVLLFDMGVCCAVAGAMLSLIFALEEAG